MSGGARDESTPLYFLFSTCEEMNNEYLGSGKFKNTSVEQHALLQAMSQRDDRRIPAAAPAVRRGVRGDDPGEVLPVDAPFHRQPPRVEPVLSVLPDEHLLQSWARLCAEVELQPGLRPGRRGTIAVLLQRCF
eukprot:gene1693-biopygen8905